MNVECFPRPPSKSGVRPVPRPPPHSKTWRRIGRFLEIIAVLEALNRLRESPDYELCQLSERKPGVLEELAAERKKLPEKESAELETQSSQLATEIAELSGQTPSRIR